MAQATFVSSAGMVLHVCDKYHYLWSGPNFTGMAIVKGYYYHGQDLFLILVNVFFFFCCFLQEIKMGTFILLPNVCYI